MFLTDHFVRSARCDWQVATDRGGLCEHRHGEIRESIQNKEGTIVIKTSSSSKGAIIFSETVAERQAKATQTSSLKSFFKVESVIV